MGKGAEEGEQREVMDRDIVHEAAIARSRFVGRIRGLFGQVCCYTVFTLYLHFFLHCCYAVLTLLLHLRYTQVMDKIGSSAGSIHFTPYAPEQNFQGFEGAFYAAVKEAAVAKHIILPD
jgi:hypothetical protein